MNVYKTAIIHLNIHAENTTHAEKSTSVGKKKKKKTLENFCSEITMLTCMLSPAIKYVRKYPHHMYIRTVKIQSCHD